jgi:hypothetical protein
MMGRKIGGVTGGGRMRAAYSKAHPDSELGSALDQLRFERQVLDQRRFERQTQMGLTQ